MKSVIGLPKTKSEAKLTSPKAATMRIKKKNIAPIFDICVMC
jgi:hypothetical protein